VIADCTQDSEHAESQVEIPSRSTEGQLEKTPPADINSSPHDETDTNRLPSAGKIITFLFSSL
jgi:hypothetical protein